MKYIQFRMLGLVLVDNSNKYNSKDQTNIITLALASIQLYSGFALAQGTILLESFVAMVFRVISEMIILWNATVFFIFNWHTHEVKW